MTFLEVNDKDPDFVDNARVLALTVGNMPAGLDTIAITLRAVFYFPIKH
jgi:hypothetical protein